MKNENIVYINNRPIKWDGEKNILALAKKAHIDIPTFCYHSDLSVFGACRLCLVEVEGKGLVTSCSTTPFAGMKIFTHNEKILRLRKTVLEMLLANHEQTCTTCEKSESCKLRELANRLGIDKVRFRKTRDLKPLDTMSECLVRDPNKCVLCGDCTRYCSEIQGIGAIEFAHRGEGVTVTPAYGKSIANVDCVNCGQCAAVCPTGAIVVKSQINDVWKDIHNQKKIVVAQIAPAIRVAMGEMFNLPPDNITTGKIVAALKLLGFDKVYDTSYAADLTVIEEANEYLKRKADKKNLPLFTSCCPAWVKFAEQSYPELLDNLSTCRSPQQMFGALAKEILPKKLNTGRENISVVSIMPCTAKKYEAKRDEFKTNGTPDVDHVLTTQELGKMIKEAGIDFPFLEPQSIDMPMGFSTGAGVIFGNSGGVSEAVIRYTADKLNIPVTKDVLLEKVRGEEGIREVEIDTGNETIKIAIVHGLKNAALLANKVVANKVDYDLIEVMACPGGCVGGAGQPIDHKCGAKKIRNKALYDNERTIPVRSSQDNPFIQELYETLLKEPNSQKSHELLHTYYKSRRRIEDEELSFSKPSGDKLAKIRVCIGTSCFLKGAQELLSMTLKEIEENGLQNHIDIAATFCTEKCNKGPTVALGDNIIHHAKFEDVKDYISAISNNVE